MGMRDPCWEHDHQTLLRFDRVDVLGHDRLLTALKLLDCVGRQHQGHCYGALGLELGHRSDVLGGT